MVKNTDYYLGLDIGTDSVGYAVTDEMYRILKFNGKAMWGSRLFDEAQTAAECRVFRTTKRRQERRKWRIGLLQELFAEEICKVDPGFYQRLKDSALWAEDKQVQDCHSLFAGNDYAEADFYRAYPTIYHLRRALITEDKKFDIRLIYLALHHIIKQRGHFLFSGSIERATSFVVAFEKLQVRLNDELGLALNCQSTAQLSSLLADKRIAKQDKSKQALKLCQYSGGDGDGKKQVKAVIDLICGKKAKLADIFLDDSLKDSDKPSFSFADAPYEDLRGILEDILLERCNVIDDIKGVYDWAILADILKLHGDEKATGTYLSMAKADSYDKHRDDLAKLKALVRKYAPTQYVSFFQKPGKDNYCAYVGSTSRGGRRIRVKKCSRDDFYKAVRKLIASGCDEKMVTDITADIDAQDFLPLQVTKDNGVIPYQVHEMELHAILQQAGRHYGFLQQADQDGITVADKIAALFKFRVPYYVGPLNPVNNKHAWMVRKEAGKIYPWNLTDKVDIDASAERFIRRMTNKCTYLLHADVLPKHSLLYSEFMVWDELNNVKIGTDKLSIEMKQIIFDNLFQRKRRITGRMLREALKSEGLEFNPEDLSGFDQNFKASLSSYQDMFKIFGTDILKHSVKMMCEDIILLITLYHDDVKMLKRIIRKKYPGNAVTDIQLKQLGKLSYQGWGRLSREFLEEIQGVDTETGEKFNIIEALRTTNDNLMQLLSQRYTFTKSIQEANKAGLQAEQSFTYDALINDLPASPSIKRAIWQTALMVREIRKIMGRDPKKIFIEMARGAEAKKRTNSRKNQLLALYKDIVDHEHDWAQELENTPESDFRSIKLFLYYTQMGKCMYTGEEIPLSRLADTTIYDRDHIYPQSKTKDDSLDNLVLVKKGKNSEKGDRLISPEIQAKMHGFWQMLKSKGLISEKKYGRLIRKTPLTDEELAGFISRQLVETRQSSKLVADLMQQLYKKSAVVYVKAGAVAEFRHEVLKMVKVRSVNDLHHAKDAYLNIVVGNVYYEKFTYNPLKWLQTHRGAEYSLNRMFDFDVKAMSAGAKEHQFAWQGGADGTIALIRKNMQRWDILYTRQATENKGGFFDQNMVKRSDNPSIQIKKGMDVTKYGGYKTLYTAYFALVESINKQGKLQRSIEAVPLYLKAAIAKDEDVFLQYCRERLDLLSPKVIIPKIRKNACMKIDGFIMHLRGTSGVQLKLQVGIQLVLPEASMLYLKKIEKYIQRSNDRGKNKQVLAITDKDKISSSENLKIYDVLYNKHKDTIYKYRPANQGKVLAAGRDKFIELSVEEQCMVINEILKLLQCKPLVASLKSIGGSATAGTVQKDKIISNCKQALLYNQSVTGLFEQCIDLLQVEPAGKPDKR